MKAFVRVVQWVLLTLVVLSAGSLLGGRFITFRDTDAELMAAFSHRPVQPTVYRYQISSQDTPQAGALRTIRFMETPANGDETRPVVLFIHGAPSSLSFFNEFFSDTTLSNQARLVSVDRPGYGYSDFGRVETSIIRQAELLQPLIDRYKKSAFLMLVGSSYGGSVAARLAMNNPAQPDGSGVDHVVFVSSALGPGLERTYAISHWVDTPALRWLVPPLLQLANDEKLAHRQALQAILPDWHKITAGVTILHGQRDELVYPTNIGFAAHQLVNARVKQFLLPENRHDIVLKKREYVTDIILNVLAQRNLKPSAVSPVVVKTQPVKAALGFEDLVSMVLRL